MDLFGVLLAFAMVPQSDVVFKEKQLQIANGARLEPNAPSMPETGSKRYAWCRAALGKSL